MSQQQPVQLPEAAQRRIADLEQRAQSGRSTAVTDLSVDEMMLISQAGFQPVGMVLGSSIYHIGFQTGRWGNQELQTLSAAMYNARELAITRMRMEAAALQADGVVGVDLDIIYHAWSEGSAEFTAVGTAVKHVESPGSWRAPDGQPFTSGLSGQAFWKLLGIGYRPLGLVLGSCVYHIAYQGFMNKLGRMGVNAEITEWTQGLYEARELAMGRMQAEAEQLGADHVVETRIMSGTHIWEAHILEFFAFGTAAGLVAGAERKITPSVVVTADEKF